MFFISTIFFSPDLIFIKARLVKVGLNSATFWLELWFSPETVSMAYCVIKKLLKIMSLKKMSCNHNPNPNLNQKKNVLTSYFFTIFTICIVPFSPQTFRFIPVALEKAKEKNMRVNMHIFFLQLLKHLYPQFVISTSSWTKFH